MVLGMVWGQSAGYHLSQWIALVVFSHFYISIWPCPIESWVNTRNICLGKGLQLLLKYSCHSVRGCCIFAWNHDACLNLSLTIRSALFDKSKASHHPLFLDNAQMKCATNPSLCMFSNNGEITATHICGLAPLPWPIPAVGKSQSFWPWLMVELSYAFGCDVGGLLTWRLYWHHFLGCP